MNAAVVTMNFSPLFFRGACDVPALTEASKQASKPLFINKGLLLTDRSISGHSSFHSPFSFNRESLCLEVSPVSYFFIREVRHDWIVADFLYSDSRKIS